MILQDNLKPGVVVHTCTPSAQKTEAGGLPV
jgi:hypothetical protein